MQVEKSTQANVTVVALIGDMDSATAGQIRGNVDQLVAGQGPVLLDLSRASCRSSAGLRVLLLVYRQARQKRLRLGLAHVPPNMHAVLSRTTFIDSFLIADTVAAGVAALR